MGRVNTNSVSLAYSIEPSLGTPGALWTLIEPNTIGDFGAVITTVSRSPISLNRQPRKGTVTDLDSSVGFDVDMTVSGFRDFIEGFAFSTGVNRDMTQIGSTAASTSNDNYTVAALTAAQAGKLNSGTLLWSAGFTNSANNGLKSVDANIATGATSITVGENLVNQTAASGQLSLTGYRIPAASSPTWAWDATGRLATLTLTGVGTTMMNLGLTPGQVVHLGSVAAIGSPIVNSFGTGHAIHGFARVATISANAVVFDKTDTALQANATAPSTPVDVLFGEFVRNVATNAADFIERSFQFEAQFPNLGLTAGVTEYQYARGNYCNTLGFNLPLTDKATLSAAFIGTDTGNPTASRGATVTSVENPTQTGAFNTSADIARLRITEVDEDGLTTDFKSITMTLNNNVSPEKVLGRVGAAFLNAGNLEVNIEAQLLFTNGAVIQKIRDNETVTMDFILRNDDGVIAVDIPSMTLGGGGREYPVNESVLLNTTAVAFQDSDLGTSMGISIMPSPIPS